MSAPRKSTGGRVGSAAHSPGRVRPITITIPLHLVLQLDITGPQAATVSLRAKHPLPALIPPAGTKAGQRWRAEGRREVMASYFTAIASGAGKRAATLAARRRALEIFDEAPHDRTIRNLVCIVVKRGGLEKTPLHLFFDGRAGVKHHRPKVGSKASAAASGAPGKGQS